MSNLVIKYKQKLNSQAWLSQAGCSCPHKDERGKVMSLLANILWDFPICFLRFVSCIVVAGSGAKRWSVKPGGKTGPTRSGVSRWRDTNESQVRVRIRCSRQTFFFDTKARRISGSGSDSTASLHSHVFFSQNVKWEQIQETYT